VVPLEARVLKNVALLRELGARVGEHPVRNRVTSST
jgi:hypothetical protein